MNSKIFELAKQAGLIEWHQISGTDAKTPDHMSIAKAEKFAELIVQECISAVRENYTNRGTTEAAIAIEQHFGVK